MLRIQEGQIKVFEAEARRRFEDEMVAHSKIYAPTLSGLLGDQRLEAAVLKAIERAAQYGFTNRGPIRLYVELMFLWGSEFDSDPQYPAAGEALHSKADQMQRADRLHNASLDYLTRVSGPENVNVRGALEAVSAFARRPPAFRAESFMDHMLQEMTRIFPQKAAYAGPIGLAALVQEARSEAQALGFLSLHAEALLLILKFAFGHGCTRDPLYPWISQTLADPRIVDPMARAQRLEKKAITWLHHVLARPKPEESA